MTIRFAVRRVVTCPSGRGVSISMVGGASWGFSRWMSLQHWRSPRRSGSPKSVKRFVDNLKESNKPRSVAIQVDMLYKAARIMMPKLDLNWLKTIKARLYVTAPAHGARGPVITSVQLLELGQQLMDESMPPSNGPIRLGDAIRYRDGLMIALLAFVPLRRKNLAALQIDRHLVQEEDE